MEKPSQIIFATRIIYDNRCAMNQTFASCFVLLLMAFGNGSLASGATVSDPILLWPQGAPDEKSDVGLEHDTTTASGRTVGGQPVIRLGNVSQPTITLYRPSKHNANGTVVMVCPGGGYSILAMDLEGAEVCKWLNSIGVTAALLKYRVPMRPGDDKHMLPLRDAQRALGLVRFHAKEWNLDPKRIGIIGFSAGGQLMGHLCNDCEKRAYDPVDEADQASCRPDFAMGIYPGVIVPTDQKKTVRPELTVTSNTPPTFLVQAEDDSVHVENSIFYYLALKNAHVPAELHLYSKGGHGYGLRPSKDPVGNWPKRAEEWLRGSGLLAKRAPEA
jgi:acetyl esterase/lipase